jgi:RNA polymerase sigma-70 factor (ECF subfamily)
MREVLGSETTSSRSETSVTPVRGDSIEASRVGLANETQQASVTGADLPDPGAPRSREAGAEYPGKGRRGSPPSWLDLYRAYGERVFRLVHRMTADEDAARDITHDTFVCAFEKLDQYAGTGSMSGWVFRIAVNLVRQRSRSGRVRMDLLERERPSFRTVARDQSGRVEAGVVLEDALAELPEELRTTLLLHEVDGYTHAEIAEMLGIAEGSSKARVSRAKAALRKALDGKV